jgi:hypothetical protein
MTALWSPPDARGPLDLADPSRVLANAATLARTGVLGTYDPASATAYMKVYLLMSVAWLRGSGSVMTAGQGLWSVIYNGPITAVALSQAATTLVDALRSGVSGTVADQYRAALKDNVAVLGLTILPVAGTPPPPVPPPPPPVPPAPPSSAPTSCGGIQPTIVGTEGADTLMGTVGADVIAGLGGRDTISGLGGGDRICGGDGDDVIDAGDGDDSVSGDAGNDVIDGGAGNDTVTGGDGNDTLAGSAGNDQLDGGAGIDTADGGAGGDGIDGGTGNDMLSGATGADWISGGADNDSISGDDGNDVGVGGDGRDSISGGAGNDAIDGQGDGDSLAGGTGADELVGGAGRDTLAGEADGDRLDGGPDGDVLDGGDAGDSCVRQAADVISTCETLTDAPALALAPPAADGSTIIVPANVAQDVTAGWVQHPDGKAQYVSTACRTKLANRGVTTAVAPLSELTAQPAEPDARDCDAIYPTGPKATTTITPGGGVLEGPEGVKLAVPAGAVSSDTKATITAVGTGYDVHLQGSWTGMVQVALPIRPLADGEVPVVGHITDDAATMDFESAVVKGGYVVTQLDSLSVLDDLKCATKILPKDVLSCVGRKEIEKQVAKKVGKKAAREMLCGDVTDILGTWLGDGACHAGESEDEIRAARRIYAEQERQAAAAKAGGGASTSGGSSSGGGGSGAARPAGAWVQLGRGPAAPYGYRYAVSVGGFAPGSTVTITCFDSVSPGGFYSFPLVTNGAGEASTANYCYSADGPAHWVTANGLDSNRVSW